MSKKSVALLILCFLAMLLLGQTNAQSQPGSPDDPLITKSYLEQFTIPQVVELQSGQTILGEAGTQFVLRVGSAYCLADPATAKGGLADLTEGVDIKHMEPVLSNHLLVCSRSDGRGLVAQTDVTLVVWGIYQVLGE